MTAQEKRMYYLMLSPSIGQEFAEEAGFSPPSTDVQEAETYDVLARWTLITTTDLLPDIIETADWFCDIREFEDVEDREDLHRILVSHGVGLLNHFLDNGKLMIVLKEEDINHG